MIKDIDYEGTLLKPRLRAFFKNGKVFTCRRYGKKNHSMKRGNLQKQLRNKVCLRDKTRDMKDEMKHGMKSYLRHTGKL